ncbi:MAG: hypothetical protein ACOCWZ_11065, partial [Spirochaetota bacterium]
MCGDDSTKKQNKYGSFVLMCRDFINDAERIQSLDSLNRSIEELIELIMESGYDNEDHLNQLYNLIKKYFSQMMTLYAKYPNDPYIDTMLRRAE